MSVQKKQKLASKAVAHQQQILSELQSVAKSVERCEKSLSDLKTEMQTVNLKHQNRKTTQDDIAFLTDLLKCANKKLAWEKQIASMQKRTPAVLDKMSSLLKDTVNPPPDLIRAEMLHSLQGVQAAMERLQNVNVS